MTASDRELRVRFAPSPTGHLHVGGARTALFNWLLARQRGGVFVLRIEDTDRERSTEAHTRAILEGMGWLGLDWDEGPRFQSEGVERHRAQARNLLEEDHAYRDFAEPGEPPRTEGDPEGEPFAIRFRVPEGETRWEDRVHGPMRFDNGEIEDFVILRRDGSPTYNFAVVSDDADEGITHVLRGDDHLSNTPKQILLYRALGEEVPRFGHFPMILGADGKRLSKRHGATSVEAYREEGILPEAMVNFLALLGWSPGDDREFMTVDELIEAFSLDRVLKKGSAFDREKLEWLNGQHLQATDAERLAPLVGEQLLRRDRLGPEALDALGEAWLEGLVELLKVRHRTVADIAEQVEPYATGPVQFDPAAVGKHWEKDPDGVARRLEAARDALAELDDEAWTLERLEETLRGLAGALEVGFGKLVQPMRVALLGTDQSPGIFDVLFYVGRDRTLRRLGRALEAVRALGGDGSAPSGEASAGAGAGE